MNLFNKIEFYYKKAQELPKYDHVVKSSINAALRQLLNHQGVERNQGDNFRQYLSDEHPDQNSNWSAHLGKLMDEINAFKRSAKTQELADHYQSVCDILSKGWDQVEQQGGKAHTSKPLCEAWTGVNNSLLPTATSSKLMRMLNKFSTY